MTARVPAEDENWESWLMEPVKTTEAEPGEPARALAFVLYLAALLLILCAIPIVVAAWRWGLGL